MFTGIIEELGKIIRINRKSDSMKLIISCNKVIQGISIGSSISVNGACLTVVEMSKNSFEVELVSETIKRMNIGELKEGSLVNLERSLKISDRLEGHFVLGHVDGTGIIERGMSPFFRRKNGTVPNEIEITIPHEFTKYIVKKGGVAVDGISLTVVDVTSNSFNVSIIPYTYKNTTLGFKNTGDKVNIEVDILAKYVEKLLNKENKITTEFLKEHGY